MRKTIRLESRLKELGLLCGGRAAKRICKITLIPSSDTTILRLIKKEVFTPLEGVSAVGVDDWAFKKRKRYGSILVNLHTGKVIDLLPDREEATLCNWLKKRPEIEVMSRDRFSNYQKAMTTGAPQAIQVTDRWHLLKNLSEAVQKILIKYYNKTNIKLIDQPQNEDNKTSSAEDTSLANKSFDELDHGGVRLQRFKVMKALQSKGYSIRAMSRHLNMSRQTIKKYLDMDTLPRKSNGYKPIERFFPYIKTRMEKEPAIFLTTLWEELKSQGYKGGYSTLSEALRYYDIRVGKKTGATKKLPTRAGVSFKPSTAAIWFVSDQAKLSEIQANILEDICSKSETIMKAFSLTQSFHRIMSQRTGKIELKSWIDRATKSEIKELVSFAKGLLQDYQSNENALTLRWSNGPVEGNVNRLKTIKRQMYGRAGFDLLRRRVVYSPT